jgi:hypothetical protein
MLLMLDVNDLNKNSETPKKYKKFRNYFEIKSAKPYLKDVSKDQTSVYVINEPFVSANMNKISISEISIETDNIAQTDLLVASLSDFILIGRGINSGKFISIYNLLVNANGGTFPSVIKVDKMSSNLVLRGGSLNIIRTRPDNDLNPLFSQLFLNAILGRNEIQTFLTQKLTVTYFRVNMLKSIKVLPPIIEDQDKILKNLAEPMNKKNSLMNELYLINQELSKIFQEIDSEIYFELPEKYIL